MNKLLLVRTSEKGISLLELLIAIFIMGTLTSITAPSWVNFINQQKLNKMTENIVLAMKEGQEKAKREKVRHSVMFQLDSGQLKYKIYNATTQATATLQSITDQPEDLTVPLSQGSTITFNHDGTVYSLSDLSANEKIVLSLPNMNPPSKRCAIVQTLLGSITTGKNTECE